MENSSELALIMIFALVDTSPSPCLAQSGRKEREGVWNPMTGAMSACRSECAISIDSTICSYQEWPTKKGTDSHLARNPKTDFVVKGKELGS